MFQVVVVETQTSSQPLPLARAVMHIWNFTPQYPLSDK
jgi:hypothetical protein